MAEITIDTDFEGGTIEIVDIDQATQTIEVMPEVVEGRGFPCWWYFRVEGLNPKLELTLKLSPNRKPFAGTRVLSHNWARPDRAAISTDGQSWSQSDKGDREGEAIIYTIQPTQSEMWIAWGPPFVPSHAKDLLLQAKHQLTDSEIFELATTRQGKKVLGIRIGAQPNASSKPYGVWVQARQHAWEAGGSWVGQGFLQWLISDDPAALKLRSEAEIYFIPIMDVDNAAEGRGGKDAVPRDHNRDWDETPHYPEVAAAQKRILELNAASKFDIFVDLHNPGPGDGKPFFYGPKLDSLNPVQLRNFNFWMLITQGMIEDSEKSFRFTSYIKSKEELDRVSKNWVLNHSAPHVLATTLETSWNRPEGTQEGYLKVGRQFGLSIARYLESNPRRKN